MCPGSVLRLDFPLTVVVGVFPRLMIFCIAAKMNVATKNERNHDG